MATRETGGGPGSSPTAGGESLAISRGQPSWWHLAPCTPRPAPRLYLGHCLPRESYKNVCVNFFLIFAKAISASRRGFMRGLIAPDYHARGQ